MKKFPLVAPRKAQDAMPMQRIIGLTGGIATGKTTVADYLATQYALPILDADHYAREAVQPGSPILQQICDRNGPSILQADGTLDRQRLGDLIFSNSEERQWLEEQIHPFVCDRIHQILQLHLQEPIVVLVIPLLFEAQMTHLVSEIWVVHCHPEQQKQRLMARNQLTPTQAEARIKSQIALTEKIAQATVALDNSKDAATLLRQVDQAIKIAPTSGD
ncbi:dephospho-CoA kinase [Acaryochloris thomasi]|nr:dephospho-CoA kinase [Acaryochloris thomasi]